MYWLIPTLTDTRDKFNPDILYIATADNKCHLCYLSLSFYYTALGGLGYNRGQAMVTEGTEGNASHETQVLKTEKEREIKTNWTVWVKRIRNETKQSRTLKECEEYENGRYLLTQSHQFNGQSVYRMDLLTRSHQLCPCDGHTHTPSHNCRLA